MQYIQYFQIKQCNVQQNVTKCYMFSTPQHNLRFFTAFIFNCHFLNSYSLSLSSICLFVSTLRSVLKVCGCPFMSTLIVRFMYILQSRIMCITLLKPSLKTRTANQAWPRTLHTASVALSSDGTIPTRSVPDK